MGPRLARFRGGVTAIVWAKAALLTAVVSVAFLALLALLGPSGVSLTNVWVTLLSVGAVVALVMAFSALAAHMFRYDVHRHGLVLFAPPLPGYGSDPEVVPWATIDPGRTFIGMSVRSGIRMPVALHRQRATFPPAVMINGWTNRPRGRNEALEAFSGGYRYQPMPSGSPFGWWQIGVTDPEAFLDAVEAAMVAEGYPAAGLVRFALGRKVRARDMRRDPSLQAERQLSDPVVGLPPP